ncbi:hypothetical protein RA086_04015 [Lactiplantibacillus sp. WILCCON 0030]|uniref:Uncharacterized protein n=1 Tax=Lactiplantibacillus brownii TaxID=3069269 RepID=A0ABU1A783_9LACO|nr:hypothetical protein [Lactiplantibacillus brownii]MDQ7936812.1 hypothetical protein [Lactiplantibacillus brownii]
MNDDAQLSITQLNDSLQHKAVEDFAKFYQRLYDANNLELMSNYPVVNNMTDINEHLNLARFMTKAQRLKDSIDFSYQDYLHLIDNLDQKYFESGNPAMTWDEWYASHFAQLSNS